ncbi:hypothetical protein HKX48_004915 [Thoreauomyces humboldtii]|nr:hypothetical protein HKX48_004915 [Thoreauomyces humboldtii]
MSSSYDHDQSRDKAQPPPPPAASYSAAPVRYSQQQQQQQQQQRQSHQQYSATTYGAPAEYYGQPSQYQYHQHHQQPQQYHSASSAGYPVGHPSSNSVPYPTGYTETEAVPYPEGYTPSAASASVSAVPAVSSSAQPKYNTDEDRKAAALAALPAVPLYPMPLAPTPAEEAKAKKRKPLLRSAGGEAWEDATLLEWDANDFRLFCGDLGNEVTDDLLLKAFSKYPSVLRARVVREQKTNKSRGFGFVSFKDPNDFVKAMREMNGKYVGNRPIKLRKSTWNDRTVDAKTLRKIQQTAIFKPVLKTVAKAPKKQAGV